MRRRSSVIATCAMLTSGLAILPAALAEHGGRPENLALETFQFGPANRWTFSHMREVLPTANIARDPERYLPLEWSENAVSDFRTGVDNGSGPHVHHTPRLESIEIQMVK